MAEIAAAFLGPVIEVVKWVGKPIMRQFSYLCCFTTNINSLKNEAEKLDDATKELEMAVQTETDNLQRIVPAVTTWLRNSNNIKDEITGILSEAKNIETGRLKLGVRFSLSKKAKKMADYTKGFRGEKNFDVISQPGLPPAAQTIPLEKTYAFASRKKIEEDIMTTLRDGNVSLIGIHGMGGLGKTTLAKKISKRVLDEHVFQAVAMAVFSQEPDYSKIQVQIGTDLGLKLREETSQGIVQKLHAKLSGTGTGAKRTLLILDDVWKRINLEELGIPCDSKWCTILVTSRHSDTLSAMGCEVENKFGMKSLHDEEAWDLFRGKAGPCVDDARLNSIAKEVVRECGELPIALVVVGLALKDKVDASIWENALREMKQCDLEDIPGYLNEVYTPLKLSYDFLESKKAESLCLLCCLFPEDYDIPLEGLTYFCMGLGIFEGIGDLKGVRNKVFSLIDSLKGRSLLLDSNKSGHVKMHDVVRDVCTVIAKKEGYIGNNDCTWISSSHLSEEQNGFPNLRLLFLSLAMEQKFKFGTAYYLEEIKDLHVLCIKNYSFTTIIRHHQSLTKLKTLILESCLKLKMISFVGQLVNLKILICRDCDSIEELPSEMKELKRLKLLELTCCRKLQSIGRGIISGLVELEELLIYGSFNKWEAEDREERKNAALRELELLKKLTRLEIEIEDPALAAENMHIVSKLERFRIEIGSHGYLPFIFDKEMSLCLYTEIHLGNWIEKQLIRDIECLYLSGNGANNVDLAKLRNIRSLKLSNCESIERSSVVDGDAFRFMEYLKLEYLPKLQEICDGPVLFQNLKKLRLTQLPALNKLWNSNQNNLVPFLSNLSSIWISNCDSLRNLEQLSLAGKDCLPQLQELYIRDCEMMEKVFLCINRQVIRKVFPKLEVVTLVRLPNLETFYQGIQGIEFPVLTTLMIQGCPKMKSIIIGRNQNNLGEIISSSSSANINDGDYLHYFCQSEKVSFGSLRFLKIDHNPFCGDEIPSSLFNGLENLTIDKYEGNISIFTLPLAKNLVNLRLLQIIECDEILKVIEVDEQVASGAQRILLFPKLEILWLSNLPKLVSFCECKCEVELPLLKHVDIRRCPSLENLSLGFLSAPDLKAFTTDLTAYVEVGVGFKVSFDSLKSLEIEGNENPLHYHRISVSLFNGLEKLKFHGCKGVASFFSSSAVENLVNLKSLRIRGCDEMLVKVIKDKEVEEDEKVLSEEGTVLFPKLETIKLMRLDKLVSFCEWKCYVELPSLRILHIENCPNLERFSLGLVAAPKLKTLGIDHKYVDGCEDLNSLLQQHL